MSARCALFFFSWMRALTRAAQGVGVWPGGACVKVNATTYAPSNSAGFYDAGAGPVACPQGYTSQALRAVSAADCWPCPNPYASFSGDPCGPWTCSNGQALRGGLCYSVSSCSLQAGYLLSAGVGCVPSPLPWQPAGWQLVGYAWSPWSAGISLAPSQVLAVQGLAFYSLGYGIYDRHWMVALGATYPLPGRVCSAALSTIAGRNYTFLAFCNATFLSFLDLSVGGRPRLLIGSAAAGYAEGFRDAALFGAELYVAVDGSGAGLYVSDSLNCAIRRVAIPTYPGDFLTRSYFVYGDTAGTCDVDAGAILSPGPLFSVQVMGGLFYWFAATGGLYQLDDATQRVTQVASSWPSWVPDLSLLLRVDALNASALALRFAGSAAVVSATFAPCGAGTTSHWGGRCTLVCSTTANYVDLTSGACLPCFTRNCLLGEGTVACAANSAQTCVPCPALGDSRIYNLPGSCALANTYFVGDCPVNMYLSLTLFAGVRICVACPPFSSTAGAGATSIDQCRCFEGATKNADGTCAVGQLYPLPTPSACPFRTYQRGAYEQCTSCRVAPFADCAVGFYPVDNGTCSPCVKPLLSNFTTNGKAPNADTSCGYECFVGFYLDAAASFAVNSC